MNRVLLSRRLIFALMCMVALLLAACGGQATPTSAPQPTEAEEEEPTTAPEDDADETEAAQDAEDEADATEAAVDTEDEATEAADDGEDEATEAADDAGDADATDEADAGDDTSAAAPSGEGHPAVVSVSTTRLRDRPSVAGQVVADLTKDQPVTILGQTPDRGYAFVRLEDGTEGWVAKQTLQLEDETADIPVMTP